MEDTALKSLPRMPSIRKEEAKATWKKENDLEKPSKVVTCPFISYSKMANKYGDIHSVSLFGHPVIVLSSLAAINEFRAASPENFNHRPVWMTNLRDAFPGIVFKGTTEYQLPHRFVLTNLKRVGMGKLGLEAQILEEKEMFMEYLEKEGVVDPNTTLAKFTSTNIMRMMFGQRWQYTDSSVANKVFSEAIHCLHAKSALGFGSIVQISSKCSKGQKRDQRESGLHTKCVSRND